MQFYYVLEDNDLCGIYTYYETVELAKLEYDSIYDMDKEYGIATFVNGRLTPTEVIESFKV